MAITVHPYKGYLNTIFHIHASGTDNIEYRVLQKSGVEDVEIMEGFVSPNQPYSLRIPTPGNFVIECSDGISIPITVEDGYKYGGSRFKRAFVFDNCPWLFIVMYDRSYFYNRDTKEAYVELVSPDIVSELSSDFVIFGNNGQDERTIYSLIDQNPILCVSNIVFTNSEIVIWQDRENEDDKTTIVVYSLKSKKEVHRIKVDSFVIDEKNYRFIYSFDGRIFAIELSGNIEKEAFSNSVTGTIVALVSPNLVISYMSVSFGKYVYVYDIDKNKCIKEIEIPGNLSRVGDTEIIDIWERQQKIRNFDKNGAKIPDATISADYIELDFYPCEWDVFYTQKHIHMENTKPYPELKQTEEIYLYSFESDLRHRLNNTFDHFLILSDTVCLYNQKESFVRNKSYSAAGYREDGNIYTNRGRVMRYVENTLYSLSRNGYWDNEKTLKLSFCYFNDFNVIENTETKQILTLNGVELGKYESIVYPNDPLKRVLRTTDFFVLSGGRFLKRNIGSMPICVSDTVQFGIDVTEDAVYLYSFNGEEAQKEQILTNLFDYSKFRDVLFSQDGSSIMYREENETTVMEIESGRTESYENISYIKQVNGIRPVFDTPSSLQPRLINPVTKMPIDCKAMSQYQFISPNGSLYADTSLKEYIEYYWLMNGVILSDEEYNRLMAKYQYPGQEKKDSDTWKKVKDLRIKLVLDHFDFLNEKFPDLLHGDKTGKNWDEIVLDEQNSNGTKKFLDKFIGTKGIALIRRSSDDSIVAKIELGKPLTYINYVSFSYDSRYIALAGYRGNSEYSWGGLFLIYDLTENNLVAFQNTNRAVWVTAFSKSNALASYTSNPFTFLAINQEEYDFEDFDEMLIDNRSFLSFSPDGIFYALSEQGYISKYDKYGNVNSDWGHQPSTLVEVRLTNHSDTCCVQFQDLSDVGIADVATRAACVASVSFSDDNKRLMMVGNDGVVIIRNLHLEDYAGE